MKILVLSAQRSTSEIFQFLTENRIPLKYCNSIEDAKSLINGDDFDVIFFDIYELLPEHFELLKFIKIKISAARVIILTEKSNVTDAVSAMKLGAFDYFVKPFNGAIILDILRDIKNSLSNKSSRETAEKSLANYIIGKNQKLRAALKRVKLIANTKVTVLITGESGTGKDLIANALHLLSDRANQPFVAVNCAALPAGLIESELFGYERGAFTGAIKTQIGKFEAANKGTLFIDEIGDMEISTQAKLLRVLENREVTRLGAQTSAQIDTRFIFATNKNLKKMVAENKFREDLYYRINVVQIELPALRERKDDIPALFKHFFNLFCLEYNKKINNIEPEVLRKISIYNWPGNIRQFRNLVENLIVLNEDGVIKLSDLPEEIRNFKIDINVNLDKEPSDNALNKSNYYQIKSLPNLDEKNTENYKMATLAEIEKNAILQTLKMTQFNRTKTAQILNVSLRTIQRKIKEYNLEKEIE